MVLCGSLPLHPADSIVTLSEALATLFQRASASAARQQPKHMRCSSTFEAMEVSRTENDRPMERSDESLIQAHLDGDATAFAFLVERYRNDLHGFLTRFLGSSAAADDVFQETFLQVHISGGTFDTQRTFKPWLFTIAANKARDFHRKRKRRLAASLQAPVGKNPDGAMLIDMIESPQERPDAPSEVADQRAVVKGVLDALPVHHREIILMGYFQRMSYQQIADALTIPLGTVKSRLHAAVALFSAQWRKARGESSGDLGDV